MREETRDAALAHARAESPREACGLVVVQKGRERYVPCRNISADPAQFILSPEDFARAEELGEVTAVFHSHVGIPPRPSDADLTACEASGLPWYIVSVPSETWHDFRPTGWRAPLVGRPWSIGVLDCYTLIRDFYREEFRIELPDFERHDAFWERGEEKYLENVESAGFFRVLDNSLRRGDVLLFQLMSEVVSHGAVYLGDDMMLHHLRGRLSSREIFGGYYRKYCTHVYRHRQLADGPTTR